MPDELIYSNFAYAIIASDWGWPTYQMYAQPPLFPYILAITTFFFQGGLETFRLIPIFFGILDVIAIYFLGKIIYSSRVGLLSALLLAFSSYHILYSRSVEIETMLIFFILASMYFFWRAYAENKLFYAAIAGIFIGLGNNTKYSEFLLYPILIFYLLWINRKGFLPGWKALLEKKFVVIIIISILVFTPVLITLYYYEVNPFYWQLFERYKTQFASYKSISQFGFTELIIRGYDNYVGMLIDATTNLSKGLYIKSGSIATMSLPQTWLLLLVISTYILLPITILYYLYFSLKNEKRESFLLIAFLIFNVFVALFATRFQYYLLWNVPLFFIMLSNMICNFRDKVNLNISGLYDIKNISRIFFILLFGIFLLSYLYIGTLSPFVNESPKVGYEKNILKIKNNISPIDPIATDAIDMTYYYFDKYDIKYVPLVQIYIIEKKLEKQYLKVNIDLLNAISPKYILVSIYSFSAYATNYDRTYIKERYNLISNENDILLFERKSS